MGKRYLIDSNILIEFAGNLLPKAASDLLTDILDNDFKISFINKIEVLGHRSADEAWSNFINQAVIIVADYDIID